METSGGSRKSYVHVILGFFAIFVIFFFFVSSRLNLNSKNWTTVYPEESNSTEELDIFFLETSKKATLTLREACSVESAALHNPGLTVRLFSLRPFSVRANSYMQTLSNMTNIRLALLNMSQVFRNTPLHGLYQSGKFDQSAYPIHHLSDASRLALMWKLGGIYLDTDIITLRPLDDLRNALGLEYDEDVANGVLAFQKHSPFVDVCMVDFAGDYQPRAWGHQGPELITRVLKRTCNVQLLSSVVNRPEACKGTRLLPQHALLPVGWKDWKSILRERDLSKFNLTGSYMLHFYGSLSHNTSVRPGSGVLLDVLARKNCPRMYKWMLKKRTC